VAEPTPTDHELLARYHQGDAGAMDLLVDRHAGTVYAFVYRFLPDPSQAEDLTQEVWLKVIRYVGGFEGRARFTTWLFRVARNVCLDHLRSQKRRARVPREDGDPFALDEIQAKGAPPPEHASNRELAAQVAEAVAHLPDNQREVFVLREEAQLTFREIALALDLPRDTVKSRMRYALGHIRRFLRRRSPSEEVTRGL
jgi:RNA polymerase sigma-70 factor (ECF subfamily)